MTRPIFASPLALLMMTVLMLSICESNELRAQTPANPVAQASSQSPTQKSLWERAGNVISGLFNSAPGIRQIRGSVIDNALEEGKAKLTATEPKFSPEEQQRIDRWRVNQWDAWFKQLSQPGNVHKSREEIKSIWIRVVIRDPDTFGDENLIDPINLRDLPYTKKPKPPLANQQQPPAKPIETSSADTGSGNVLSEKALRAGQVPSSLKNQVERRLADEQRYAYLPPEDGYEAEPTVDHRAQSQAAALEQSFGTGYESQYEHERGIRESEARLRDTLVELMATPQGRAAAIDLLRIKTAFQPGWGMQEALDDFHSTVEEDRQRTQWENAQLGAWKWVQETYSTLRPSDQWAVFTTNIYLRPEHFGPRLIIRGQKPYDPESAALTDITINGQKLNPAARPQRQRLYYAPAPAVRHAAPAVAATPAASFVSIRTGAAVEPAIAVAPAPHYAAAVAPDYAAPVAVAPAAGVVAAAHAEAGVAVAPAPYYATAVEAAPVGAAVAVAPEAGVVVVAPAARVVRAAAVAPVVVGRPRVVGRRVVAATGAVAATTAVAARTVVRRRVIADRPVRRPVVAAATAGTRVVGAATRVVRPRGVRARRVVGRVGRFR